MNSLAVKVLLAQGELGTLDYFADLLIRSEGTPFTLECVRGNKECKRAISESFYDVCLLESNVNSEHGLDLIYRKLLLKPDTPFILVSDTDNHDLDIAAIRAGAVDFIVSAHVTSSFLERTIRHAIERKRMENALNVTQQKAAQLAAIVEGSDYAIKGKTLDGIVTSWNPAAERLYGYSANEMIGQPIDKLVPPDRPNEINALLERISRGEKVRTYETVRQSKDGRLVDVSLSISPIRDSSGRIVGASTIANDIRERKRSEAQIKQHLSRIQALRTIDIAITGSLDLRVTLNVLLDQVTHHLKVDSAAVLLLNPHTHLLEYSTGRGFRTPLLQKASLRIGQGAAGRAALERNIVKIPDLTAQNVEFVRSPCIADEKFVTYFAAPLITKGRVAGVLELYHRSELIEDPDWMDFLETLARQAAIAIENADLFNDLQRSNVELEMAYDSTLEGWSKALDLRDRETEGHTLRVTEGSISLARAMAIADPEVVQLRRGALLHDIGKMGIPDSILLKPGSLTESEWQIMKQHPVYAYELLAPIPFLRGALDIPYCHHEKWDGSGYPRGLQGDQIPLAARLFSIVDVWDALRSDRPYRAAWSDDRVLSHIASGSGTHFDPDVANVFLNTVLQ